MVMRGNLKLFHILVYSILITGSPYGSIAADRSPMPPSIKGITLPSDALPSPAPLPVTPPGNDGLLSGMTPGSYKIPSGWSLYQETDYEGTQPSGETWVLWAASVQTDRSHGGSRSLGGTYSSGQNDVAWRMDGSVLGKYSEVYLSFYEYIESHALFNDEFFLARFGVRDPFQEILADWYWAPGFNQPRATLYEVSQGVRDGRMAQKSATVPKGAWHQWEIHYRPNTSGSSDGFYRIYLDGTLFLSAENANLNSTVNMNNADVQVGGVYTKGVWMLDYPTCSVPSGCSKYPGEGTDYCSEHMRLPNGSTWSNQSFAAPVCNPIDPPLAPFKRYFDDIIVMKK